MRYVAFSSDATGYPQSIEVLMADGKVATYKRTGMVKGGGKNG